MEAAGKGESGKEVEARMMVKWGVLAMEAAGEGESGVEVEARIALVTWGVGDDGSIWNSREWRGSVGEVSSGEMGEGDDGSGWKRRQWHGSEVSSTYCNGKI